MEILCGRKRGQNMKLITLNTHSLIEEHYEEKLHAFAEMGLPCFEPLGAFYAFPCIKEFGMTSDEFASRLLKEEKVAVVPGSAFGECGEGYLRISYAYSLEDLKKALDRMADFVKRLKEEGSR